jgi:hypothetical protein
MAVPSGNESAIWEKVDYIRALQETTVYFDKNR